MRRILLFVVVPLIVVNAQTKVVSFSEAGAYHAEVLQVGPKSSPIYDFIVDDFDRDGTDELGIIRQHPDVSVGATAYEQDEDTYTFGSLYGLGEPDNIKNLGNYTFLFPVRNHPIYKYVVTFPGKTHTLVYLFNGRFEIVKTLKTIRGQDNSGTGEWNGHCRFVDMWDYNQDGRLDLILCFNSGADAVPRCLLGLDVKTDSTLFRWDFAPMPGNVRIANMDNGSDYKLVSKFVGAGHGEFFGPFKRNESYLAVFDKQGRVLKSWEHAGVNTQVDYCLDDVNHDSYLDIVAVFWSKVEKGSQTPNTIRVIDGASLKQVLVLDAGEEQKFKDIQPLQCKNRQNSRFITNDRSMNLRILTFNSDSSTFAIETQLTGLDASAGNFSTFDINRDGNDEILVASRALQNIFVFDQELHVLAAIKYLGHMSRFRVRSGYGFDGASVYFIEDQHLKRADLPTDILFPPPVLNLNSLGIAARLDGSAFVVVLGALFLSLVFVHITLVKRRKISSLVDSQYVAAILMNPWGKIVWANGAMMRLIGDGRRIKGVDLPDLLRNRKYEAILPHFRVFIRSKQSHLQQGIQIRDEHGKHNFLIEFTRVNQRIQLIVLQNSPASLEKLEVWASMAQRLVHKAKTPLSSMLLSVQRMQRELRKDEKAAARYMPYLENMDSEIDRIRTKVNEFLRFARLRPTNFQPCQINALLNEICDQARHTHFGRAHLQCELPETEQHVLVDVEQIKEAFLNFIDNAVEAGKNNDAHILISCTLQNQPIPDSNKVYVEISDDGVGIPKQNLERILQPGFTSKENGSGMGLLIAKTLIEQNDGEVVITSRENIGTTVTVMLPLINPQNNGEST